jgi:hypothetical protein
MPLEDERRTQQVKIEKTKAARRLAVKNTRTSKEILREHAATTLVGAIEETH